MLLRFPAGVLAVAAVVLGGACGSSEPPVADRLTACEVVTLRELETAVRLPMAEPAAASDAATDQLAGRSGCAWASDDGSVGVLVELVRTADMSRSVRRTGFSAAARFQATKSEHPDAVLPDGSLYVDEESKLWILEEDSLVVIEVAATPTSEARRIATALGARAAPRLERADS